MLLDSEIDALEIYEVPTARSHLITLSALDNVCAVTCLLLKLEEEKVMEEVKALV